MKTIFILFFISFYFFSCNGQNLNRTEFDEDAQQIILIGHANTHAFELEPFKEWFNKEYNAYKVDDLSLKQIDRNDFGDNIKITIVFGSWCGDSRREVPRFMKILDYLKYDLDNLNIICVNRKKMANGTNVASLNIEKVPDFIFYRGDKEIGRIIESPQETLERDMVKILKH